MPRTKHHRHSCLTDKQCETYPLERIAEAQSAFLTKNHVGKIVLTVAAGTD
jgi:hypothetical protein